MACPFVRPRPGGPGPARQGRYLRGGGGGEGIQTLPPPPLSSLCRACMPAALRAPSNKEMELIWHSRNKGGRGDAGDAGDAPPGGASPRRRRPGRRDVDVLNQHCKIQNKLQNLQNFRPKLPYLLNTLLFISFQINYEIRKENSGYCPQLSLQFLHGRLRHLRSETYIRLESRPLALHERRLASARRGGGGGELCIHRDAEECSAVVQCSAVRLGGGRQGKDAPAGAVTAYSTALAIGSMTQEIYSSDNPESSALRALRAVTVSRRDAGQMLLHQMKLAP